MEWATATDEELLIAARRHGAAFEEFFRRHAPSVLAFFARRTDSPEAAADLMAETFAAALLTLRRFSRQPEQATVWLFAIARNKLADHYRRRSSDRRALRRIGLEPLALEDADLARIERLAELADVGAVVNDGLAALPDDQRHAVQEHIVNERPYRDIAAEAGTTEAVIRQRVSRGLRAIRGGLEQT